MRVLLLAFLFCLTSTIANAQPAIKMDKPIVCFPTATLLKTLKNNYKEEPVVVGKHGLYEDVITAVYVNADVGTYTIVEMDKTIGCIVSIGTDFQFRMPKIDTNQ